ncbi:MAG: succinate dehydrogenase, hydrophobic membrane anchor protein [Hyphomicrobiaceae bacterium]
MATTFSKMRTPLKNVRRLGSAKEGTDHFWRQRVTAVSNLILTPLFVVLIAFLAGADYSAVRPVLAHPVVTLVFILFIASALIHMRLGMQTIIEDYVHGESAKIVLLMLNTFFVIVIGAISVFSLLKLSFGA